MGSVVHLMMLFQQ